MNWDTVITPDMIFSFFEYKRTEEARATASCNQKLIPQITASMSGFEESGAALLEGVAEDISEDAQTRAEEDINTEKRTDTVKAEIHNNEKILEFQTILERLIAQELRSQNEDEERCRSLDFAIRRQQMARREAAAASEKREKENTGTA